jgi:AAA domain
MHEEYEDVPNIPGAEKHKYKPKSDNSPDNSDTIAPARRLSAELSAVITITNPFEPEHISNFLAFTPPPREWLLGTVICRTFLTVMSASGGTGKSGLVIIWAIALATKRAIAGFHIHKRARVLVLTFEDTADEYRRRFAAAFMQHGLDHKEADGYLYVKSLNGIGVTIGSVQHSRTEGPTVLPTSAPGLIEDVISRLNIDVVTLDPFVKCSGVPENAAMLHASYSTTTERGSTNQEIWKHRGAQVHLLTAHASA